MPTYEKRNADGEVVERTTTHADNPNGYDAQMAALAADETSDWHLVDEHQALAEPEPAPAPAPVSAAAAPVPTDTVDEHQADVDAEPAPATTTTFEEA
jgi:hypothetical protein